MNLLIITNNLQRSSFRQRIEIYLDMLRDNGIDCEVACLPSVSLSRLKLFKRTADFDGVFLQRKGLNPFDAFWLRKFSKKLIYDFDDAIMYSTKSPNLNSLLHLRRFQRSVRISDAIIAGNSYLAAQAQRINHNVHIIPTGLNIYDYQQCDHIEKKDKIRLVWIGCKSTLRYLAEIVPALDEIGSQFNNVVLRIVSDEFLEVKNIEVEKHQWSLEKQGVELATSNIGLAPLPDNRFTKGKCGFKILQYMASGLPVIASPVGVNAEYVVDGITGFHASSNSEWIDRVSKLVKNRQMRKDMGQAGRASVEKFDLKIVGNQLVKLIKTNLN
ncbi:MAG: glycosyltransferase family 4 protein, partial [Planctomycetota bacterium]